MKQTLKILSFGLLLGLAVPAVTIQASANQTAEADRTAHVSNFQELQAAVSQAAYGEVIVINQDIVLTEALEFNESASDRAITFRSRENTVKLIAADSCHLGINQDQNHLVLSFENVVLDGNKTGGGIHIRYTADVTLNNPVIQDTAGTWGGAISVADTKLTISGGTIQNGQAEYSGGAIDSNFSQINLNHVSIHHCAAQDEGGAIALFDSTLSVTGGDIQNNTSAFEGGAVASRASDIELTDTIIANNKTLGKEGELIEGRHGTYNLQDYSRSRPSNGGGIHMDDLNRLAIRGNSVIKDNQSVCGGSYLTNAEDRAMHQQKIDASVVWTEGYDYVYNNHDVSYWWGEYHRPEGNQ